MVRRVIYASFGVAALVSAAGLVVLGSPAAYPASTATINGSSVLQPIDGFG